MEWIAAGAKPKGVAPVGIKDLLDALERKWRDRANELILRPQHHLYHKGMMAAYDEVLNSIIEAKEIASNDELSEPPTKTP